MKFFITGGSRGIGAEIVLHAIAKGHEVAFAYARNQEAAEEIVAKAREIDSECRCKSYQMNVADAAEVERVSDQVLDDFEHVDVIVNCAAITKDNLLVSMSDDEWNQVIATNLTGPFLVCRQFLPSMLANRFGRIINISSVSYQGTSGQANYAASKSGLHGLTLTLAKEYGRKGITSNAIVAGVFDTDMTRDAMSGANLELQTKYSPMRRLGKLSELAGVVTFLASEEAGYINGELLHVTGGFGWSI